MLIGSPQSLRIWMALLALQTEEAKGVRPRDWNPLPTEEISDADLTGREHLFSHLMTFYRKLDEESEEEALEHLEKVLARLGSVSKALHQMVFLEAAAVSARIRKNAAQARVWRERACKLKKPKSLAVVDAEIAMCEGRYDDAVRHWEAARAQLVRKGLDSGLIRFAKERCAEREALCRALQESGTILTSRPDAG